MVLECCPIPPSQSLQSNAMANISPRAKLNYDSDTFSVDFNVEEYSPEVDITITC